ncbi:helix-turn-helix transcriptional regulator [Staphylococcus equorum]|uniref:helix-turn-helix transcriptional regulator n=1 Tax=Staphylococcus equorum TaxID=246432 RepID=UPI002DBA5354|nr:helix-turn-helix transcriptional regulator [Staphylococcus equorum]MEB7758798.1 helix-turn-helix domain-containing protein [Staphylococcus equorum]MEB7761382.1 helix-turn-helix domain-containing protein [Staphylococcus equorum]
MMTKKSELKQQFLKPKIKLKEERLKRGLSATYVSQLIGIDRRQYESKEKGLFSFHDYEIKVISESLDIDKEVFFI